MGLIDKRVHLRPTEYEVFNDYTNAFRQSYWLHTEYNYSEDVQDYKVRLNDKERNAIKNCLLAISQVELSIKQFFLRLPEWFPKPEILSAAATAAETEARHTDTYAHLLDLMGLHEEFGKIYDIPAINDRIKFLDKYVASPQRGDYKKFVKSLFVFSVFTEHISLYSSFLIIKSFQKERNMFKGVSNAISSTRAEEDLHGNMIIDIIKILQVENPEWFDDDFYNTIYEACRKAFKAEQKMLDWIFEAGELDFLPREVIEDFIKDRFNKDLNAVGMDSIFAVNDDNLELTEWFNVENRGTTQVDFFSQRPTSYSIGNRGFTEDDLF